MPRYFKGLYMSFGMFCAVPLPVNIWDDKCMNLMLPCFPLVGAIIGAMWWGLAELLVFSGINIILVSAVLAVFPFFITGFLHLDGYMDTSDAVLSRRPLEDKLRILKDPHTGAFAVIMVAVLFTMQFAAVYVIIENAQYFIILIFIAVISRCCSGLANLCFKPMAQSGYGNMFKTNTGIQHKIFLGFILLIAIGLSFWFARIYGLIAAASVILGFIAAMAYAYKDFKGISGDLIGFALVISELCGFFAFAVTAGGGIIK